MIGNAINLLGLALLVAAIVAVIKNPYHRGDQVRKDRARRLEILKLKMIGGHKPTQEEQADLFGKQMEM